MTPKNFYTTYYPHALRAEKDSGIPALAMLAQSALETGYGKRTPGNMMFGIKAGNAWRGATQLLTTTEVHSHATAVYPQVLLITKRPDGKYVYKVRDYFRAYPSPYESFMDYASFIKKNSRYAKALQQKKTLYYLREVAAAGYATDPAYYDKLERIVNDFLKS